MANQVTVRYGSKGAKQITGEITSVRDAFNRLQKQGAKGFGVGVGATVTAKAFNLVGDAIGAVTDEIGTSIQAYREEEQSQAQLRTSLRANITAWDGNTDAIERTIQKRVDLGFQDDEQRASLSKLVAAYGDVNKALEVQRTAMDLARFSGVDLATAGDTLIKVHAGNYRALKSLGIQTKDVTNETQALAAVQKVAQGQAESYAATIDGKLSVALAKANEKQEEFGRRWAEIQGQLAGTAVDVLDMNDALTGADKALSGIAFDTLPQFWAAERAVQRALYDGKNDVKDYGDELIGLRTSATGARPPVKALAGAIDDEAVAAANAKTQTDGLVKSIEDGLFGDAINAGNEQQLKDNIKDLREQRKEVEKGSPKWIELTGQIAENQQALFDLQYQMALKEGPDALKKFLDAEATKFGIANVAILKQINLLKILNGIYGTSSGDLGRIIGGIGGQPGGFGGKIIPGARASGGPVTAGSTYTVGENGPETLVMGGANGTIIPHGAGGSINVNVTVSGGIMTPGVSEELGRKLGPTIAKYMQQRGMVAGARAF